MRVSRRHGSKSARRLFAALAVAGALLAVLPRPASAQGDPFLPWPFTTPVTDVLRRQQAADFAEMREKEVYEKTMERIYDEMAGLGIGAYHWRSVAQALDDVEGVLEAGASLGYRADGLGARVDGLFRVSGGYSPYADQVERWEAALESYKTMAGTGPFFADDMEKASETVGDIKTQIENIGQGFFGLVELGAHQESAQSEAQAGVMAAEEMMQMREAIALQTNADVIGVLERIAQDRLVQTLLVCHLQNEGCPLAGGTWADDWVWEPYAGGAGEDEEEEDGEDEEEEAWCYADGDRACCLDPVTMELTCEGGEEEEEDYGTCYEDADGYHCYDEEQICHTDGVASWCEPRQECVATGDDYCCMDVITEETTCEALETCASEGDQRCCYNRASEETTCNDLFTCEASGSDYCCTNGQTGETTCEALEDGACWMDGDETQCCYGEGAGVTCEALFTCEAIGAEYCCTDNETEETACEPLRSCVEEGDQVCCTDAETNETTCGPAQTCEAAGAEYCCTDRATGETECVPNGACRPAGTEVCCFNAQSGVDVCEAAEDNECIDYDDQTCCFDAVREEWRCTSE